MAMLGLIGRRVGSAPTALVAARARLAGANSLRRSPPTGFLFAGAADGVLPHSPPTTALYRGPPLSFPFAIIGSGGTSSLAAGGGGAIGVPCLPTTSAAAVGGKVQSLASAGGATSAISRARIGGQPRRVSPPTSGLAFAPLGNGVMPSPVRSTAGGLRDYTSGPGSESNFSTLWCLKKRVDDCDDGIRKLQDIAAANHGEYVKMLESVLSRLDTVTSSLVSLQKGARLRMVVLRSIVGVVVGYAMVILLAVGTSLCLDMPYDQPKENFISVVAALARGVMRHPDVQKEAATYGAILTCAFRESMFSLKNPHVISKHEFAERVSKITHSSMAIISDCNGRCKEVTLIEKLKLVGHGDAALNMEVLRFLAKHGFLKKETETKTTLRMKFSTVYYSYTKEALEWCTLVNCKKRYARL